MPVEHEAPEEVIQALRQKVLDASTSLPAKYRALFALRNLKGPSAEAALICGRSLLPLPLYQVHQVTSFNFWQVLCYTLHTKT
jgi:hypothetical protein